MRLAAPALTSTALALAPAPRTARADDTASQAPSSSAAAGLTPLATDDLRDAGETPRPRLGLQPGVRLGYALPMGTVGGSNSGGSTHLSALETASVPIGIDLGYRLSPVVYLGGSLLWAAGIDPNGGGPCKSAGVSCSRQDAQLRFDARFYFAPRARTSGWGSIGAGWEVATFSQSSGGPATTSTLTGPILSDLQIGFDVRGGMVAIGPYLGVTIAEFLTEGIHPASAPVSTWIDDPSLHAWVTLGVRGSYGPW